MTTIAVRAGVMASDSRATYESEAGGHRVGPCTKLYRRAGAIIGTAGEVAPALAFLAWYGKTVAKAPEFLRKGEGDFTAMVLRTDGAVLLYEGSCYAEPYPGEFWAIGSGAKAALGALLLDGRLHPRQRRAQRYDRAFVARLLPSLAVAASFG